MGPVVSVPPSRGMTVRVRLMVVEILPVASVAVTVMLLNPIASGTLSMVQFTPLIEAPSDAPVLVIQVTTAPPLPPVTVPESEIDAEVVVAGGTLTVRTSGFGFERIKRVTLTVCETLPFASAAVTVMLLNPIASGILTMVQFTPMIDAPSDAAALVTHVTAGALPPVTVPERVIVAAVVVAGGTLIVSTRGLGGTNTWRVTLTVLETLPVASVAVTVMPFNPMASGILNMVQFRPMAEVVIDAPSDAPVLVTHVTAGVPLPPVTVPERLIDAEVVVAGGGLIVRASGPGGTVPVRAAYRVWMAAMSPGARVVFIFR